MKKNLLGLLLVIIFSLLSGFFVYRQWHKIPRTLKWDNAWHAVAASEIAADIKKLDIKSLYRDTNKQNLHPFMESYIWGIFFVIFGINDNSAVFCGLLLFMLSLIMLFKSCVLLDEEFGWLIGLITCLIMLCIPINLVYATQVMTEMPCLLLITTSIYFYLKTFDKEAWLYSLFAGIAISALFFTKYNYGVILCLLIVFWEIIHYGNYTL